MWGSRSAACQSSCEDQIEALPKPIRVGSDVFRRVVEPCLTDIDKQLILNENIVNIWHLGPLRADSNYKISSQQPAHDSMQEPSLQARETGGAAGTSRGSSRAIVPHRDTQPDDTIPYRHSNFAFRYEKGAYTRRGAESWLMFSRDHANGKREVALKVARPDFKKNLKREYETLMAVFEKGRENPSCQHVVRALDYFTYDGKSVMVLPRMASDVFRLFHSQEKETIRYEWDFAGLRKLLHDVLKGLQCLRSAGYAHGDIKLENVLVVSMRPFDDIHGQMEFRVADLSGARFYTEKPRMHTNHYLPPEMGEEMLAKKKLEDYSSMDMWAVGLMALELMEPAIRKSASAESTRLKSYIASDQPFSFKHEITSLILKNKPNLLPKKDLDMLKDLVEQLMNFDPTERLTIEQALAHPLFDVFRSGST